MFDLFEFVGYGANVPVRTQRLASCQTRAAVTAMMRIVILRFVYLQHLRTENASRKAGEMTAAVLSAPGSYIPIPNMRDAMKTAVQIAML